MTNRNYWIHRISHCWEISYPLLDEGYLSIGFSDFLRNESFLETMKDENNGSRWTIFEEENMKIWNGKYRTRYNLWRFLCEFRIGDYVLVPKGSVFDVYEIESKPISIGNAVGSLCENNKLGKINKDERYIFNEKNGEREIIDLGFAIKVKEVAKGIEKNKYATDRLCKRLKIYQTNANINELSDDVLEVLERFNRKKVINVYGELYDAIEGKMKDIIDNYINDIRFEKMVACYLKSIGADEVKVLSKRIGKEYADGDVRAVFDNINVVIYVQVKHHTGETSNWSVEQIKELKKQKIEEEYDNGYIINTWVISSADKFSETAIIDARNNNVRLINGGEFRRMLINAGLSEVKDEFEIEEYKVGDEEIVEGIL